MFFVVKIDLLNFLLPVSDLFLKKNFFPKSFLIKTSFFFIFFKFFNAALYLVKSLSDTENSVSKAFTDFKQICFSINVAPANTAAEAILKSFEYSENPISQLNFFS